MIRSLLAAGVLSLIAVGHANAAVIFDGGPVAGGHAYGAWVNEAAGQNFVVKVSFADAVTVNGFDIYISPYVPAAGASVELKIFSSDPSLVTGLTPNTYFSTLDNIQVYEINDVDLGHADFAPISLAAGNYWIGLSSATNNDISWVSYRKPDGTPERPLTDQLQLGGNTFNSNPGIYDLAFNIDGSFNAISAVPEPDTWILFIFGFGFIGATMRAAKRHSARARLA